MSQTRPPVYDDRYAAPVEASRRGAHRARPHPLAVILPVIGGLLVVLIVAGVSVALLRGSPGTNSGGASNLGAEPTATATPPAAAATGTVPSPAGSVTPSDTGSLASTETGSVDHGIAINIVNTVGVTGLGRKAAGVLEKADWTKVIKPGDSTMRLTNTAIYYGRTADKASAEQVAADLGLSADAVSKSAAKAGTGISVQLGQDYANS